MSGGQPPKTTSGGRAMPPENLKNARHSALQLSLGYLVSGK